MFHDFFVRLFFFLNQGRGKATPKRRGGGGGGGGNFLSEFTYTFWFNMNQLFLPCFLHERLFFKMTKLQISFKNTLIDSPLVVV